MIEKNALRVGNLVVLAHESNAPIVEIKEIGKYGCVIDFNDGNGQRFKAYEDLLPIKLSEYWLERLGFEKEEKEAHMVGIDKYRVYTLGKFTYNTLHGWWYYNRHLDIQPTSLHQLMNLYFSLTGKELTLKEPING